MQSNNSDCDCFKILTLQEISKIRNRLQVEHCAYSEVTRLCQWAGCARNRHVCPTVQRNLKLCLWIQVYAWTEFPSSILGIRILLRCTQIQIRSRKTSKHEEIRCTTKYQRSDEQYISSDAHNTHIFLVSTSHHSSHKSCAQNSHFWSALSCHSLVLMSVLSRLSASHLLPLCFPFHSFSYRVEFSLSVDSEESLTGRLDLKHRLSVQHRPQSRDMFHDDLRPDGQLPGKSITECFRADPASKIQKQQSQISSWHGTDSVWFQQKVLLTTKARQCF